MPSKLMAECNRYKAQLKSLVADHKVTKAEVTKLVKEAKSGEFSEVKAHYLVGFLAHYGDQFDPSAKKALEAFVKTDMKAYAKIAAETGNDIEGPGQPKLALTDARSGTVSYREKAGGQVAVGGFGLDDVMQGGLGDCYLLASLSAVAQTHPELLKQAITTHRDGTYTVTFYEREDMSKPPKAEKVTVDGKFAMRQGEFVYAAAREPKELWPQIFEKAYAQWKGGFGKTEGGMGADALQALTGATPDFGMITPTMKPDEVYGALKKALANGGCAVTLSQPFTKTKGIVPDHAYTLLGVEEKGGEKFVKVRNPWGSMEVGADGKDDGVFSMPIADYVKAFTMYEFVQPGMR